MATTEDEETEEFTIDELARRTGMTARNIRAHQSRGLVPPPIIRIRTGYYTSEHLERIQLIQDMQSQGFNLKAIERLLEIGARSGSRQAIEFERTLLKPFGSEQPMAIAEEDLHDLFGNPPNEDLVARAEAIGLLKPIGNGAWEVPSPTMLRAGRELTELGIPIEHALAVADSINTHTTSIALEFVRLFVKDILDPLRKEGAAGEEDLSTAAEAVERLRPLATEAVMASFAQVMTRAVERQLGREVD